MFLIILQKTQIRYKRDKKQYKEKFNLKTPGREEDESTTLENDKSSDEISSLIVQGLGGKLNIVDIDCCATRLRITVKNAEKVKEKILKSAGAAGVIKKGEGVQIIYGPNVNIVKTNLEDYLPDVPDELL